ncbi:MAG: hypothetical protein AABW49_03985 [Nanoarchaeota archaeon]
MESTTIIGGAIALLVIIIIISIFARTSEKKYYKKAERAHKQSVKYHELGDSEIAGEYAEEAITYRKKAEAMNNAVV